MSVKQEEMMAAKGYLSVRKAATITGVDVSTVYRYIRERKLRSITVTGRRYVLTQDVIAYAGKEGAKELEIPGA